MISTRRRSFRSSTAREEIGAELFLLDDGWFGNKHPRDNDNAGLGDWQVDVRKLPHGLSYLADAAHKRGIQFGIWMEPEMVNPASELFEKDPEWAMQQPHREPDLSRNQLDLDLANPAVREFAWHAIDNTLAPNPGIVYMKWDANRYVTQPGSTYLAPEAQSNLMIDYNNALYDIMARLAKIHPNVMAMACAGGSGRADYGAMRYFHSFWTSDNTDPRTNLHPVGLLAFLPRLRDLGACDAHGQSPAEVRTRRCPQRRLRHRHRREPLLTPGLQSDCVGGKALQR